MPFRSNELSSNTFDRISIERKDSSERKHSHVSLASRSTVPQKSLHNTLNSREYIPPNQTISIKKKLRKPPMAPNENNRYGNLNIQDHR